MKKIITSIILLCTAIIDHAQDINFSQFYELPLLRNPALAGVFNGDVRIQSVYRSQWQSVTVPYKTGGISGELKLLNDWTIGLQTTYDVAGDSRLSRVQVLPVISKHINLNGDGGAYITAAFMGGIVTSQFDPTQLKWDDQFVNGQYSATNPTRQVLNHTGKNYMDLSAGVSLLSPFGDNNSFYIGAGLFHFNRPEVGFQVATDSISKLNQKWALNAGMTVSTTDFSRVSLYADFFSQSDHFMKGGHQQFMAGAFYTYDISQYDEDLDDKTALSFGGLYRWNDAFVPVLRLDHHHFSVGLSYDVNVSKLKTASQARGGFELTLNYKSFISSRAVSAYRMSCPGF
ncbi:MAG: PorP/SprF family type IX secretion system membrane protein [Chitinophagaceae bacterium]